MTREEARLELDATTLRPQDASADARAMAESDSSLAQWVARRTEFDESVSAVFTPSVPAGLRERLLQNAAPSSTTRTTKWLRPTLVTAAAASIMLGWTLYWPLSGNLSAWESESLLAITKVEYGMSRLDERAATLDTVKKLLAANGSPSPQNLPGCLCSLPTFGCKRIQVAGRAATLICFKIDGQKEAHLIVMDNTSLADTPSQKQPRFQTSKNWQLATWSDGSQTYLLATTADENALRKLLALG